MKDEIKEIVVDNGELIAYYKDGSFQAFDTLLQEVLDYITNLQTIEQQYSDILSENAELRIQISAREEEYIKLQEENEYSNHCNEELRKKITNLEYKIERLKEDNKNLKELCNKYEEEHKTTFEEWKKDINIIDELEKWIKENNLGKYRTENVVNTDELLDKLNELKEK